VSSQRLEFAAREAHLRSCCHLATIGDEFRRCGRTPDLPTYRCAVTVSIRDARPDDAEEIAKVHVETWQSAYRDILPAEFLCGLSANLDRRTDWWREQIGSAQPPRHTFVAVDDGELVGFADIGPSRGSDADPLRVGELNAIYVLPSAWGRGVGQALMAETIARLGAAGFSLATLWVLEGNHRARRFYEAAGWDADGSVKDEAIGDVVGREVRYRMELKDEL